MIPSLPKDRTKLLLLFVLLYFSCSFMHSLARMFALERNFGDYALFYTQTTLLGSGENIFVPNKLEFRQRIDMPVHVCGSFNGAAGNSPFYFLTISPFARVSFWPSVALWTAFNLLLLLAGLFWLDKAMEGLNADRWLTRIMLGMIALSSQPLLENIGLGQNNLFIFAALAGALLLHRRDRHFLAGCALAFVLTIKQQYGMLAIFFLWRREYKVLAGITGGFIALHGLSTLVYGLPVELAYWKNLLAISSRLSTSAWNMDLSLKSLIGLIIAPLAGAAAARVFYPAVFVLATGVCLKQVRGAGSTRLLTGFSLFLCLSFLLSPLSEEPHLVMMIGPLAAAFLLLGENTADRLLWVGAFLLINLRYSLASFSAIPVWMEPLYYLKTAGVVSLLILLLRQARTQPLPGSQGPDARVSN